MEEELYVSSYIANCTFYHFTDYSGEGRCLLCGEWESRTKVIVFWLNLLIREHIKNKYLVNELSWLELTLKV